MFRIMKGEVLSDEAIELCYSTPYGEALAHLKKHLFFLAEAGFVDSLNYTQVLETLNKMIIACGEHLS